MACQWYKESSEGIIVNIRAQPRSSSIGLDGIMDGALKLRVHSAPVDGKANKEITELIASIFRIPKSSVIFKSGETSKIKRIELKGLAPQTAEKIVENIIANNDKGSCRK